jgi:cysteine desulfurase/selenocysteine lyase
MTIAELHADEALRRHEFPAAASGVYLAHAGVCPLPRRVSDAITQYLVSATREDQESELAHLLRGTRPLAARLLNAQPEEIAFVGPTSLGLSFVARGLSFRKHEHILACFDDFPSNVYPWMALANRGVPVRFVQPRSPGCIRLVDVMGQVDENTRLVALTSCHFVGGYRIDLDAIGRELHSRGILFCVDGIQTLGAFPTTVEHVDFLASDAHKWLLGPCASGILYVRKELQDKLAPIVHGWNNVRCPNYTPQEQMVLRQDAQRYEAGTHNILGIVGLKAAIELLLEVGIDNIAAELLRKRSWFIPALQAKGYFVQNADSAPQNASGIISCHHVDRDMPALHAHLSNNQIVSSLRVDKTGKRLLRFSPHFYNTDAELHRVLELL